MFGEGLSSAMATLHLIP